MAVGRCGLAYTDFLELTPVEFNEISKQFFEQENEKQKDEWERARLGWYFSLLGHMGKKTPKPKQLVRFHWDGATKSSKPVLPTQKEMEALEKRQNGKNIKWKKL